MNKVRLNKEIFIKRALLKHGNTYSYDKLIFNGINTKVLITCYKHGDFEQLAHSHLSGSGCSKCSFDKIHNGKILTTDDFIQKAKKVHGDKYDYSKVEYFNNVTKVKIICPIHGEFEQTPQHHKRGSECKKCANIKTGKAAIDTSRGWSLTEWNNKIKSSNSKPLLYVIECFNDTENFIKIGITMRTAKKRFCNKTLMPYNFKVIIEHTGTPEKIFNLEIKLKQILKKETYKPSIKFSGWNECFNLKSEEELLKLINNE